MSDPSVNGIILTKDYYKDFLPTDLQWPVTKIDDDFTLYDLFVLINHAETMIPGITSSFGMSQFDKFFDEIQKDIDIDYTTDISYLELCWSIYYDVRLTNKTGKPTDQKNINMLPDNNKNYWDDPKGGEISNLMNFHGVGPGCSFNNLDMHECGDDCQKTTGYAIELTPVNNLANLPIRVLPIVEFYPPYIESDRKFHRTGFKLKIDPTLWCCITSVLWELTFFGSTPENVADKYKEINDSLDDIKDQIGDS